MTPKFCDILCSLFALLPLSILGFLNPTDLDLHVNTPTQGTFPDILNLLYPVILSYCCTLRFLVGNINYIYNYLSKINYT